MACIIASSESYSSRLLFKCMGGCNRYCELVLCNLLFQYRSR